MESINGERVSSSGLSTHSVDTDIVAVVFITVSFLYFRFISYNSCVCACAFARDISCRLLSYIFIHSRFTVFNDWEKKNDVEISYINCNMSHEKIASAR